MLIRFEIRAKKCPRIRAWSRRVFLPAALHILFKLIELVLEDAENQFLLAREVVQETAFTDRCGCGNFLERHTPDAFLNQNQFSGRKYSGLGTFGLAHR